MTNIKLRSQLLALLLMTAMSVSLVSGQTAQTASAINDPLAALPASDGVIFVDVRRIMTELVPRIFANDPAKLAMMMGALNDVSAKTGVNLLSINRVVVGVRFLGPVFPKPEKENIGIAVIVRGDSHANSVIEFLKTITKGKLAQETYSGKVIYSEPPPTAPRKRTERATPALAMLDADTIVLGDLPQVRATIDSAAGNGRVESSLVELATRDSNALMGAAVTVPDTLKQSLAASAPKDAMAQGIVKFLSSIKQTYSSVGMSATDYNIITGARFESPAQAESVGDILQGLRQQAGSFIPDPKIRTLIDTLQVTTQGDAVQIRADLKNEMVQELITALMKEMNKKEAEATSAAKAAPAKPKGKTKSRRGRRRRGR